MKKDKQRGVSALIIILILLVILLSGAIVAMLVIRNNSGHTETVQRTEEEKRDRDEKEDLKKEKKDGATDEEEEPETEEAEEPDDSYKAAYAEVLRNNLTSINDYDWQYEYISEDDGGFAYPQTPKPVAFCDVNGDGVDELFYMHAVNEYQADIQIDTYVDGEVIEVFSDSYDIMVAGGFYYCIFQVAGSDDLFVRFDGGDETWDTYFRQYHMDGTGNFQLVHEWHKEEGPDEDYTKTIETYTLDEKEIDKKTYTKKEEELGGAITRILLYNNALSRFKLSSADDSKFIGMTVDEALAMIPQGDPLSPEETKAFYQSLPDSFGFSSGAGAWGTGVTIREDGSFEGGFHDSNMGESGDGYDATVYYCNFSGSFKEVRKINDYTYVLYLDELLMADKEGEERIEDVDSAKVRYVAATPYGMEGSPAFYVYTPDAPLDKLPEEFKGWIYGLSDKTGKLDMYGLYNVAQKEGFSGYSE